MGRKTGTTLHFGGVPTDIEVRAIRERWPEHTLEAGQVLAYDDIADVAGITRGSGRWASVTARWRRTCEAHGVLIGTERGEGFKVLGARDRLELSEHKFGCAVRATRRSLRVAGSVATSELTQEERARLDFTQRRAAAVLGTAQIRAAADLPRLTRTGKDTS